MDSPQRLKTVTGLAVSALGAFLASVPDSVIALSLLMLLDIVSGFIAGGRNGALSSEISAQGLKRKGQTVIIVLMVAVLERFAGLDLPFSLVSAVALFYCAHEALSIIENAAEAGLPIPDVLRQALARLNGTQDQATGTADKRS